MQISVAMATFNGEAFLAQQLESLASQSRPPDELVISDDGSSDSTVTIASQFARRAPFQVKVIGNRERVGHGENFFRAITRCSGDLIALCDQDDVWQPDKLARCERPFHDDRDVSLVTHSARVVDDQLGHLDANWLGHISKRSALPAGSLPPFQCDRFAGFTLVFRSIFSRVAHVDNRPSRYGLGERFRFGEADHIPHDAWANLVCGALGTIVMLPDELVLYRRHGVNTSEGGGERRRDLVRGAFGLRTEAASYRARAEAAQAWRSYLEKLRPLARELGPTACTGLEQTIGAYDRYAQAMERRADAYAHDEVSTRASMVIHHTLRGDYGRRSRGGLGLASLTRDVVIGLGRDTRSGRRGRL